MAEGPGTALGWRAEQLQGSVGARGARQSSSEHPGQGPAGRGSRLGDLPGLARLGREKADALKATVGRPGSVRHRTACLQLSSAREGPRTGGPGDGGAWWPPHQRLRPLKTHWSGLKNRSCPSCFSEVGNSAVGRHEGTRQEVALHGLKWVK